VEISLIYIVALTVQTIFLTFRQTLFENHLV
jgi:hypothetical protein